MSNIAKKNVVGVSKDFYPSSKDLFSFIRGQNISNQRLKNFLVNKGIFCSFEKTSSYAEVITSFFLDNKEIEELLSYANVRENKFKSSTVQLNSEKINTATIVSSLESNLFAGIDTDLRIKVENLDVKPEVDPKTNEIVFKQTFKKIDYSKTTLLQETSHELIVKFVPKEGGAYDMVVHSSAPEGQLLVSKIKDKISEKSGSETLFFEINEADMNWESRNKFFDEIMDSSSLGFGFDNVEEVKLKNSDKGEETEGSVDGEGLSDVISDDDPRIRTLTVQGKSIYSLPDVQKWLKQGYYIKSAYAIFTLKLSSSTYGYIGILMEFDSNGLFQSQVKKSWMIDDEGVKNPYSLSVVEKEGITRTINAVAIGVFDKLRTEPVKK